MVKYCYSRQKRLGIVLLCFIKLGLCFSGTSVFATLDDTEGMGRQPVNISARLNNIDDALYKELHGQRSFLNLTDAAEPFRLLNEGTEAPWDRVAVFSYALLSDLTMAVNPFDVEDAHKNQYGLILTRGTDILIVFRGSNTAGESSSFGYLSPRDSARVYDFCPDDHRMRYIRHFFGIPDRYHYARRSWLYKSTIGLLSPRDWSMWAYAAEVHKGVLYAALCAQTEVFSLVDQYTTARDVAIHNIILTGHREGAGISSIFSGLLYQKLEESRVNIPMRISNFEAPPVFNRSAEDCFRRKIGDDNITDILSSADQELQDNLYRGLREATGLA